MPDPVTAKVEDAVAAVLAGVTGVGGTLAGWTVLTQHSADQAVDAAKAIVVYTASASMDQSDEQGQTLWDQTLELEFINEKQASGSISRANQVAIANAHAALAANRTLGGRLHDLQEIDIAGVQAEGKDVDSASLQYRAQFFTPRDDWFTILGQNGVSF